MKASLFERIETQKVLDLSDDLTMLLASGIPFLQIPRPQILRNHEIRLIECDIKAIAGQIGFIYPYPFVIKFFYDHQFNLF